MTLYTVLGTWQMPDFGCDELFALLQEFPVLGSKKPVMGIFSSFRGSCLHTLPVCSV